MTTIDTRTAADDLAVRRILDIGKTMPESMRAAAQAYVDELVAPSRTASEDTQNLVSSAESDIDELIVNLKKVTRTVRWISWLPGRIGESSVLTRGDQLASQCEDIIRHCSVTIAATGQLALSTTRRALTTGPEQVEHLTRSAGDVQDDDTRATFVNGAQTLSDNVQLMRAQQSLVQNLNEALTSAVQQVEIVAQSLRATRATIVQAREHRDLQHELSAADRKAGLLRAKMTLQKTVTTLRRAGGDRA